MSYTLKIASNTFYQLVAKAISVVTTVAVTALITRTMGISSFGAFFLMSNFATYFFLLLDFGINTVVTREISNNNTLSNEYFRNVLTLRLIYSLILVIIVSLLLPLIPFKLTNYSFLRLGVFIGLLVLMSQAIYNSCTIVFQSHLDYKKVVISSLIGNGVLFIFLFPVVFFTKNLMLMVVTNTAGSFLVSIIALYLVKQIIGRVGFSFNFVLWKRLFKLALPLGVAIFLTVIVSKADSFLLSIMDLSKSLTPGNAQALGNYGLAYKVFENILVLPTYFVNALFPVMVFHKGESIGKLKNTLKKSLGTMFIVSLLVVAVGWVFSPLAIFILSGEGGQNLATLSLRILIIGLPLFFCSAVLMFFLITVGLEKKLPLIYAIAAVFNVVLNYFYIPSFGYIASSVITGVTEVLILLLLLVFTFNYLKSLEHHEQI